MRRIRRTQSDVSKKRVSVRRDEPRVMRQTQSFGPLGLPNPHSVHMTTSQRPLQPLAWPFHHRLMRLDVPKFFQSPTFVSEAV